MVLPTLRPLAGRAPRFLTYGVAALLAVLTPSQGMSSTRRVPEDLPTIQGALDASAPGDTVLVSPGTYTGQGNRDITFHGYDVVIKSVDGPEHTIIDCQYAGRGFHLSRHETRECLIDGFTIQNGYPTDFPPDGGAIYLGASDPSIVDCRFIGNMAFAGGAIILMASSARIDRCLFWGNQTTYDEGGAIFYYAGSPEIIDCVIAHNSADRGGGYAILGMGLGIPTFRGCTIACNTADRDGGGIFGSPFILEKCVVWGNESFDGYDEIYAVADMYCCDVDTSGVAAGTVTYDDCIFTDPLFCDDWCTDASGLTLHADSPCLPERSPCDQLIGALGQGCGTPTPRGACCLSDQSCRLGTETWCDDQDGRYIGDDVPCEPDPCTVNPVQVTSWGKIKSTFLPQR